jgi:hypothetical protein
MPKLRHADEHMLFLGRNSELKRFASLPAGRRLLFTEIMALLTGHPAGLFRSLTAMPFVAQHRRLAACPVRARSKGRLQ